MNCDTLFTYTTVDEQRNLFTGETQDSYEFSSDEITLAPGMYRVVDGKICKVLTGASPEEIKRRFDQIAKTHDE